MTKDDEAIVEAMARAMAVAEGRDPDSECFCESEVFGTNSWLHPAYHDYLGFCRRQYAAHLAMLKAIEELDRREAAEFASRLEKQEDASE